MVVYFVEIECPHCGEKYHISSNYCEYPKAHKVCDTCNIPFEVKNHFYEIECLENTKEFE